MTIKVFVDWLNKEILTKEEYNKLAREMAEEHRTDDYSFSEFLENHYTHRELFEANEKERATIMECWVDRCLEDAYDELGYQEVELEV